MKFLHVNWTGHLTNGWSAWYDHAGSFFVIGSQSDNNPRSNT